MQRGLVLHIGFGQGADRGRAEADQGVSGVDGVALKVPPKLASSLRFCQRVVGLGEMIEPDRLVAESPEAVAGMLELGPARHGVRKSCFVDQLLMSLHPGHMGVTEQRQPIRLQAGRRIHRSPDAAQVLMRQAVHQIDIDRLDPGLSQPIDDPSRGRERLDAIDRFLHLGIDILQADAGAGDANGGEGSDLVLAEAARVDLDRELGIIGDRELVMQMLAEPADVVTFENGRAAAAEMEVTELATGTEGRCDKIDLGKQQVEKAGHRVVAIDDLGVATAEPAKRVAKRHMDIKRDRHLRRQCSQPIGITFAAA